MARFGSQGSRYFGQQDLVAGGAKVVDPADLTVTPEIGAPTASVKIQAAPEAVAVVPEIGAPTVTVQAKTAAPDDLSATPELATARLIRATRPDDLTVSPELETPTAPRRRSTAPDDLTVSPELGQPAAVIQGKAQPRPVTVTPELADADVIKQARPVDAEDLTVAPSIDAPRLIKLAAVDGVTVAPELTEPSASLRDKAQPEDLTVAPAISNPSLARHRQALPADVSVLPTLATPIASIPPRRLEFPEMAIELQRIVIDHLGERISIDATGKEVKGIFESEWIDPALGPLGFEGNTTRLELMDEDAKLARLDSITRIRDGQQYRVKETRPEEFDWTTYLLERVA